jgi:hypothetical protein
MQADFILRNGYIPEKYVKIKHLAGKVGQYIGLTT